MRASVRLPSPLTLNTMHTVARGRKIKSARYREWCAEAAQMVLAQRLAWGAQMRHVGPGPYVLVFDIPDRLWQSGRRVGSNADIDNRVKCLSDALVDGGVIADDSKKHVAKITARWVEASEATVHIEAA